MNSAMPTPSQPAMQPASNNILTKPMSLGGTPMKHGKSLKAIIVGIFVLILLVVTAVISYNIGVNVATEDNMNVVTPQPNPQTVIKDSTKPDYAPDSYTTDMRFPAPDGTVPTGTEIPEGGDPTLM